MTNQELYRYSNYYRNFINCGLGEKYQTQELNFKALAYTEQGKSLSRKQIGMLLDSVKKKLIRAFGNMAKSTEFNTHKASLARWQQDVEWADSATGIGLICQEASQTLFPDLGDDDQRLLV